MDMCSAGQPARYALFRNIAIGIGHLHANDILHRDLKLENTLISDNLEIKLADFGWAIKVDCYASAYLGSERVGTANYMAPEIIKFNQYSFASDMFAFGSMLFALCEHYDALCYEGWTELKIMNYIGNHGMAKVPISDKTEPAIAALIRSCWQTDASKRPTASEAVAIIDAIAQHANVMNRKTSS
jgi:serine/threonine protein kinase